MSNSKHCNKCNEGTEKLYEVKRAIGKYAKQCCVCTNSSRKAQHKANALIKNQSTRDRANQLEPALYTYTKTNVLE